MNISNLNILIGSSKLNISNNFDLTNGQKVIGKVLTISPGEAVLDIAGHHFQAKIEGSPELREGHLLLLQVQTDATGRTVFKVLPNSIQNEMMTSKIFMDENEGSQNLLATALAKAGLQVSPENFQKIIQFSREFQVKMGQPINPQILVHIVANQLPLTTGTLLTSWLYQDQELRDLLWNILQSSLGESGNDSDVLNKYAMNATSEADQIAAKLFEVSSPEVSTTAVTQTVITADHFLPEIVNMAEDNISMALIPDEEVHKILSQQSGGDGSKPLSKELVPVSANQELVSSADKVMITPTKLMKSVLAELNLTETDHQKIQTVLENNIVYSQSHANDALANGNILPLLIRNSFGELRECFIEWKQSKQSSNKAEIEQSIQMTIPTDNLGDIRLSIRIRNKVNKINFRVNSQIIQDYILNHCPELQEVMGTNTLVSVSLNTKANHSSIQNSKVDLKA